jgi:hypothetical protein
VIGIYTAQNCLTKARVGLNWIAWVLQIAVFTGIYANSASAGEVQFKISKTHGLYNFIGTIAGNPHSSGVIFKAFEQSPSNNAQTKGLLEELLKHVAPLSVGFNYPGIPISRKSGQGIDDIFNVQSILADSLDDFSSRTMGLIPVANHSGFFAALRRLEPVYDQVVWNGTHGQLETYVKTLQSKVQSWNLQDMFERAKIFYRANWPEIQPFVVGFYPIPGSQGNSEAESMGPVESVGVIVGADDFEGRFGVIFHEMMHSLYNSQIVEFQSEFESYFSSKNDPFGRYAYAEINEGLATAIGNGWAFERAAGKLDDTEWYNDPYTEGFSRQLYPLVKDYLEQKKPVDREFVNRAVELYRQKFPNAPREFSNVMKRVVILTEGKTPAPGEVQKAARAHFRINSVKQASPASAPESLDLLQKASSTALIVVGQGSESSLSNLSGILPLSKSQLSGLKKEKAGRVLCGVGKNGLAFVVLKVSGNAPDLKGAFGSLKAKSLCPVGGSFAL